MFSFLFVEQLKRDLCFNNFRNGQALFASFFGTYATPSGYPEVCIPLSQIADEVSTKFLFSLFKLTPRYYPSSPPRLLDPLGPLRGIRLNHYRDPLYFQYQFPGDPAALVGGESCGYLPSGDQ